MKKERVGTFFLSLLFLLSAVTAFAQGNKINLTANKVALPSALNQVERQSGYYKINYDYNQVNKYRVTAEIKNKTAIEAVNMLLAKLPLAAKVDGRYIQIRNQASKTSAQQNGKSYGGKGVSGHVADRNGEPLIGVTVKVPGTQKMAVTDIEGNFVLPTAELGDRVEISYIGKKAINRKARSHRLNIVLDDEDNTLGDVMVTGYQQLSRERATGSFDKIGEKELAARPATDLSAALQGLVAGMQGTENEDGSVDFKIRGTSSLYANTSPLIVVDGFPIEGTFSSINPNDVESVTVLKDASAASIWGARSANGVIVVTTKKGKKNSRLDVNGQAFWRIGTTPDVDYILAQADSKSNVDYEIQAIQNGWNMGEYTQGGIDGLMTGLTEAQELYFNHKYNGLSEQKMNAGLDKLRNRSNRKQLKKYLMQQQLLQQYNASISGGTDKFDNYLSLMYEKNAEATIKRGYERFMMNYNTAYHFNRNITATASLTWQKRNQQNSGVTINEFANLQPYEMLKNDDGSYAYNTGGFNRQELQNINTSSYPYSDFSYNMLQEVENRDYRTKSNNLRIQLGLNAKIFKGLSYDMKYQYERNYSSYRNLDGEATYATRYDVNFYSSVDKNLNCVNTYLPKGARIDSGSSENHNQVFRNQLTYNNVIAEKHDISALAGIEMSEYVTSSTTNPRLYGFNENTNTAPVPYYGSKSNIGNMQNYAFYTSYYLIPYLGYKFSERTDRYLSYFGNVAYMYDDKYGVSASVRSDGSNFVSKDKSLRWSPMWSVGAKWNMKKENFMKDVNWLDRLTLRATYGLNGNAEKSTSPQTLISISSSATTMTDVASIASYGNPLLKWETTHTTNLGVDFSFFKNILSGKFEYYNRLSKDVIGEVTIPSVYGSTNQRFNNAEISNRGFEAELTARYTFCFGLGIRSTLTYAYNKNKVEKLYNPNIYCYGYMYASEASNGYFIEGKPIGAVYAYEYAGMQDGVPYVKGPDGSTCSFEDLSLHNSTFGSDQFLTYKGSVIAPSTFGWANEFSWKGLSLYVYLTGKMGGKFRAPVAETPPLVGGGNEFISKFISYYQNSDGTQYPTLPEVNDYMCYRWGRYMPYLSCFVEDASFIRLKELTLSYQLPTVLLSKIGLKQAKVFCQARDLGCIWAANSLGYDPEWLPGSGMNKPATSITLGVNINL